MSRVAIIDHGLGNLQAVEKALLKAGGGATVFRCSDPDALRRADCVVLPGGGKLNDCVDELRRLGIADLLPELMREKPLLAISVGMHALGRQGLGLMDFETLPLNAGDSADVRLPHMGWNRVHCCSGHACWDGVRTRASFTPAASPDAGRRLFELLCGAAAASGVRTATGRFGADMQVSLVNDGPVTFWLAS